MDADIREDLYNNIVICGGSSLFPGFKERFQKKMIPYAQTPTQIEIDAPENR